MKRVAVYFIVLCAATFIAGVVPVLNDLWFFFAVSFIMSWWILKAKVFSLGWVPAAKKDVWQFLAGLGTGVLMLLLAVLLTLYLTNAVWRFNTKVDPIYLGISFLMCLWSAFVQEFVFRGFPFQALLKRYAPWKAQLIIAIPFGLMHISSGMSATDMILVMCTTGLGSVLFGLAYLKTGKLFLPIGIHMGWNYAQQMIPRVETNDTHGIISITKSNANYDDLSVLVPYFFVVLVVIIILSFRRSSN